MHLVFSSLIIDVNENLHGKTGLRALIPFLLLCGQRDMLCTPLQKATQMKHLFEAMNRTVIIPEGYCSKSPRLAHS